MAIANGGTLGSSVPKTASATATHTTITTAPAVGGQVFAFAVFDNIATVDGQSNTVSLADNLGTPNIWTKVGEWTNTVGGAALDGVSVALWHTHVRTALAIGTILTYSFTSAAVTAKTIGAWSYTVAAGNTLFCDDWVAGVADNGTSSPSLTVPRTGVALQASTSYLQTAVVGAEQTQTSFAWTEDASFTNRISNGTTGSTAQTNVKALFSDRIASLTTDTHQGTSGLTHDWVAMLAAWREVPIPRRQALVGVGGATL